MSAETSGRDQTRKKTKIKSSFTLIEVLVVISIVLSFSVIFLTKGVDFVKNYQLSQEKKIFDYCLDRAIFFAKIHNCPVEISLVYRENQGVILEVKDLMYSKVFKNMNLRNKQTVFSISPHEEPNRSLLKENFF